ncbi:MAG: RNA methyltransferase [Euryarchaeota archaeon]|nr:RNA methyltransferase [Euryarchaeota archaeon]
MKPRSLALLLPSSLAIDASDLRSKTAKIGQIARAASVFRADRIIIYHDPDLDETELIERILNYAETPQYLRKRLIPLADDLRYAGTIPPLRTPHHPLDADKIEIGDTRVGVVVRVHENGSWVDIGSKRFAFLNVSMQKGERVNVRITSNKPLKAIPVGDDEIIGYWGYSVARAGTLSRALTLTLASTQAPGLRIATSKYGESIDADLLRKIGVESGSEDVLVVFGAPHKGISEILDEERRGERKNSSIVEFDYTINALPDQGTATVRLEEAVVATLAILNLAFH